MATPSTSSSRLFLGTSGWAYPTWKPGFYPPGTAAKSFLAYYATRLSSVEVNYTFRTLPSPKQLEGWLTAVPSPFRFTFKAPQRITHFNRLRDCKPLLEEFLAALAPVREAKQLGLILFQLPPNFAATGEHAERLAAFLEHSSLITHRIAFEFRHASWFTEATYSLLRSRNAALCIAESDDLATPEVHTADTYTCFRLRHSGGYSHAELEELSRKLTALARDREVYAYLKHEDDPTGALDAAELLRLAGAGSA
ncbi:MAG TPA: DUF72 domain-containing protein [Granulicella sp.]